MAIGDGRTFALTSRGRIEARYVTRWEEIQETVLYHAELAGTLGMTTSFRLLNPVNNEPDEFCVFNDGPAGVNQELRLGRNVINRAKPTGVTPLTRHILDIEQKIQRLADGLRERGQRVSVLSMDLARRWFVLPVVVTSQLNLGYTFCWLVGDCGPGNRWVSVC